MNTTQNYHFFFLTSPLNKVRKTLRLCPYCRFDGLYQIRFIRFFRIAQFALHLLSSNQFISQERKRRFTFEEGAAPQRKIKGKDNIQRQG